MCMTVKEMNETMEAIQEWKRVKEEAELKRQRDVRPPIKKEIQFLNLSAVCVKLHTHGLREKPLIKKK